MATAAVAQEPLLRKPLYVYDLPPEILDTLETKEATAARDEIISPDVTTKQSRSAVSEDGELPKATSCALCSLSFANVDEQRSHVRSDLHNYNLKRKMRSLKPVQEAEFEKLVGDLDESLSGSESSGSDSDFEESEASSSKHKDNDTMLSHLLKKQANVTDSATEEVSSRKRKRGAGTPPLIWFKSSKLHSDISLGIYRAIFTKAEQSSTDLVATIRHKQLPTNTTAAAPPKAKAPTTPRDREEQGGVALPPSSSSLPTQPALPHVFLCMIGGGHFAAMLVSLAPKVSKSHGSQERQAGVLAHKTFHRYTTRRKQGGSQSANDAKGAANSAGASLRRYNETALTNDVRELLAEWKPMIDVAQLFFIRATGNTNRRTLFGPYEGQVLNHRDERIRGFPFSTRRPTQAELMRCFVELTRVKVREVDEAALAAAAQAQEAADAEKQKQDSAATSTTTSKPPTPAKKDPEAETAALHTAQIEALIRRSKAPALLNYMSTNSLHADYALHPPDSPAHFHAPTPLHAAASANSPALVLALLTKARADPTRRNGDGRTAVEIAGDRATRDAFRQARSELGEAAWPWDEGAKVADALTKAQVEERAERERREQSEREAKERSDSLKAFEEEQGKKDTARTEARMERRGGRGQSLGLGAGTVNKTAEQRREEEARGMTPEMRMRLERERRARAAEERMKAARG